MPDGLQNLRYSEALPRALAHYDGETLPVPVAAIAQALDLRVLAHKNYTQAGSGHLAKLDGEDHYSIIVNSTESPARKRFTIAHEIAHALMDGDYVAEHGSIDRDGEIHDRTYRRREANANSFAAELLMPEDLFVEHWEKCENIEEIAGIFSVSRDAARYRAINLGLMRA